MEQLNLFGMPEMFLGDYHRAIKRGNWEALPGIILSLDEPRNRSPDWQNKKRFWESELSKLKEKENGSPKKMAAYWETLLLNYPETGLKEELANLQGYWFTRLADKFRDEDFDYLTDNIHPVFCLVKIGRYQSAGRMALRYLNEIGENARLRTYQSFCFDKMNMKSKAITALSFALFYDPLSVDMQFVFNEKVKSIFETLKEDYADRRFVRARWPFECWLSRLLEIPMDKELVNRMSEICQGSFLTKDVQTDFEAQIYFNRLLYLAEVIRKETPLVTNEVLDIRNRMKAINGDAFKRYMEGIV